MKRRARHIWLRVHFYVGITAGAVFALLGVTGSILVFYNNIDAMLNPAVRVSDRVESSRVVSAQAVLDALRRAHPQRTGPWRIEMPLNDDSPIMARYYRPTETSDHTFAPLMVMLDPVTLSPTATRFWGEYAVTWIYDLHYSLLLDKTGQTTVGILGLIMLLSLITGLVLWWPSRARLLRAVKPVIRHGSARSNYDLHTLSGVYGWIVLVMLALTGAVLALPEWTRSIIDAVAQHTYKAPPEKTVAAETGARLNLDVAVTIAKRHFPDAEVRWVESSGAEGSTVSVKVRQPFEPSRRFPQTQLWLDQNTGAVEKIWDPKENAAGNTFLDWMHPLHNGEAFGLVGRWLVCTTGLLPTLLFVTGFRRWRQKCRAEKNRGRTPIIHC